MATAPSAELAGKTALVTGASRNIGRAIAVALAAGGAAVAVNARTSREDAEKVAQEIRGAGGKAEVFMADIVDAKAVNAMVEGIVKRFGRLDILVLNASVRKETPFIDMSFDEWKTLTSVTLDGSFHCVKACLPHMVKAGGGAIVTLGGMTALSGAKRRVHGSVGKFGLYGFTRALAKELGGKDGAGVIVATVVPPPTKRSLPIVHEYQAAIEKQLGKKEWSFTSLESFIGAKVMVEALRRAGPKLTREGFMRELDNMKAYDTGGYVVGFAPNNHNGSSFVELTVIGRDLKFSY